MEQKGQRTHGYEQQCVVIAGVGIGGLNGNGKNTIKKSASG